MSEQQKVLSNGDKPNAAPAPSQAAKAGAIRPLPWARLASAELHCEENATLRITKGLPIQWDGT